MLYVAGIGRSGTTLLSRLLGQLPGCCAVGEVVNLWRQGVLLNEWCGCGTPFHDCPFWHAVGRNAFGGWDRVDAYRALSGLAAVDRMRFVPALATWPTRELQRAMHEYGDLHVALCRAIVRVSGCSVVVDASKHPPLAHCLHHMSGLDLRVVHLVRDSRGVCFSWGKRVRRPESPQRATFMDQFSPYRTAMLWNSCNLALELLAWRARPVLRLRYEDMVRFPRAAVATVGRYAGLTVTEASLRFLSGNGGWLDSSHCVAGNPMRFTYGRVPIREDNAWRSGLPDRHRRLVTLLTLPLLSRYRYLSRPARPPR